jgi:dTDP-4-dehydrorhamnose reductase
MRIAVTGSQGQIVRSLLERAVDRDTDIVTLARPNVDLSDLSSIAPAVEFVAPELIVHAAAYTAVDKAEAEQELAHQINAIGAGSVAAAARRLGIPIVHLSTDYVFDGTLDRSYREDDPTRPLNAYGRSKLAGERAVKEANPRHVILRTSRVYSPFGANFVRTMLRLGETRNEISVVADQIGQPTSALDIADAILAICRNLKAATGDERLLGTFHLAAAGAACWADLAEAIFAEAAHHGRPQVSVKRITADQYPTPARRPANSRLDTRKLAQVYGIALPEWRASLPATVARLVRSG